MKKEEEHCFICTEPIAWVAFGPCNHKVCHTCCLRLRALYKKKDCAYCKTEMEQVVISSKTDKVFEDFKLNQMKKDVKLNIFFDSATSYNQAMELLRFTCPDPNCDVICGGGWPDLKNHVKKAHKKIMCDVCTAFKKAFTHEHVLYDKDTLAIHNSVGDKDDPSFKGHPSCEFCQTLFYGIDELYDHCNKQHEQCFLCQRNGVRHQYYPDYTWLEKHFHQDHFPCTKPECLEKKFVVFDSEMDLQGHQLEEHADAKQKARGIQVAVNFDYARRQPESRSRRPESRSGSQGSLRLAHFVDGSIGDDRGLSGSLEGLNRGSSHNDSSRAGRQEKNSRGNAEPRANHQEGVRGQRNQRSRTNTRSNDELEAPIQSRMHRAPVGFGQLSEPVVVQPVPVVPAEPTPAEMMALQPSSAPTPSSKPILNGDPDLVRAIEKLLGGQDKIIKFKDLTRDFKSNNIDAFNMLQAFSSLALVDKPLKAQKSTIDELGRVWHRMAESVPEDKSAVVNVVPKKKKKGLSLAEFEALNRATPRREAMIKAWNNFKAMVIVLM